MSAKTKSGASDIDNASIDGSWLYRPAARFISVRRFPRFRARLILQRFGQKSRRRLADDDVFEAEPSIDVSRARVVVQDLERQFAATLPSRAIFDCLQ